VGLLKGLTDPVVNLSMGQTAEILAYHFKITREQMDEFALASHEKLAEALTHHRLSEITPFISDDGFIFEHDNGLRIDSSMEQLGILKAVFDKDGLVSAGNSAQVTDGAACLLLASEQAIDQYHLPILGELVDSQWAGLDPAKMGLGPVHASTPLLQRHNLSLGDIDYWEINEAFAAQVLACLAAWKDDEYCQQELGLEESFGELDMTRLNVDGGAIALGHPVGATGARIVLHLLKVLERNKAQKGVATLCIGGGQGGAMLLSREEVST
jgi:acetyl-CoA C-acetyltransferase